MHRFMILLALLVPWVHAAPSSRPLLEVVDVQGIRNNQLVGYGLVVGLSGTGDKTQVKFTSHSLKNMLEQFGVNLPNGVDPKMKNVAAVAVHAMLPPQASAGQTLNITVSSLGDAKSLRGGTLLMTPLQGVDGQVYAVAQGNLVVGGISVEGRDGTSVTVNTPTVGTIPSGAIVERGISTSFNADDDVVLNLKQANFTTARNIERAINQSFGPDVARADSAAKVLVRAPRDHRQRVTFMSMLEAIEVSSGKRPARVVFNSRTGTVVIGADVKVSKAAVSHGNLSVAISETPFVSQPGAFGGGNTVNGSNSSIDVTQDGGTAFVLPEGTSLEVIVDAINSLGATPADLMVILQALDEAGALNAELVVI
ncbi:flagellar basal body P-ring protein FlgI [uncultured Ferrimonas sp.]|uniref:flagellar basal body P-ring protein FlgI n=1 Tax=uncultured Ferrimonas sp. TaxID=432640 RepID=UPI0026328E0C|nr:flagellar basal body P-ring protein FlgI [uncultured Ferrimonas sp.]